MNATNNFHELDKLGQLIMTDLRDVAIGGVDGIFDKRHSFHPTDRKLRESIHTAGFINEEKIVKAVVTHCIDYALSEFLSNFSDVDSASTEGVVILEDGVDIREARVSAQTQLFNRWIERFSRYEEDPLEDKNKS